jgi:GNAT superfamily N-acetyltransferase
VTATIRDYASADEPAIVALSLRAWEIPFASMRDALGDEIYLRIWPEWRENQTDAVRGTLGDPKMRSWVAEDAGALAGFACAFGEAESSAGAVEMIAVDPAHQRRGIGAALVERAEQWMRDQGLLKMVIETGGDPGHASARALYEAAGMTKLTIARYFKAL